ncbi:hypothetical protein BJ138DRAFT_1168011 [Hygrophoropsis aurantiaca]|uniref:Uncharacterized protein n=1 Tax=Hygrophoropsis aurantiaca TaxID=72124 RepID=A0ACB7ZRR1_9AGAM|nr:hypothetical protein BJ138DRAFT_1168011 [Hygrophoropsis aurantiaca]
MPAAPVHIPLTTVSTLRIDAARFPLDESALRQTLALARDCGVLSVSVGYGEGSPTHRSEAWLTLDADFGAFDKADEFEKQCALEDFFEWKAAVEEVLLLEEPRLSLVQGRGGLESWQGAAKQQEEDGDEEEEEEFGVEGYSAYKPHDLALATDSGYASSSYASSSSAYSPAFSAYSPAFSTYSPAYASSSYASSICETPISEYAPTPISEYAHAPVSEYTPEYAPGYTYKHPQLHSDPVSKSKMHSHPHSDEQLQFPVHSQLHFPVHFRDSEMDWE